MNCSEFGGLLDLYIDGALDEEKRAAFLKHADLCSDCREQLRAAEQLRDILSHMDEDIAVPLPAQAAWRNAVRGEAKQRQLKRIYGAVGAVAAMCVLTVGVTAMLRSHSDVTPGAGVETATATDVQLAYVEADGVSQEAALEEAVEPMMMRSMSVPEPYAQRLIVTEDIEAAQAYLKDIVEEYDGFVERENENSGAKEIYLRVPGENVVDFISAVDHIGTASEDTVFQYDAASDTVGICVTISMN